MNKEENHIGETLFPVAYSIKMETGKRIAKFPIRTEDGKILNCVAFDEVADIARDKLVKEGIKVNVCGYRKDYKGKEDFNIKFFTAPGTALTKAEQLKAHHGSVERFKKKAEEIEQSRLAAGYVRALCRGDTPEDDTYDWHERKRCVWVKWRHPETGEEKGCWMPKIEFLMEVLGPKMVRDELRSYNPTNIQSFPREQYARKIEELMEAAKYFLKTPIVTHERPQETVLSPFEDDFGGFV